MVENKKSIGINENNVVKNNIKKLRRLLENDANKKTAYDQKMEEKKFLNNLRDLKVNVNFIDLEIYDNVVLWGGTVDGIIQFIYKVTQNESTSGVEFNYLNDFTPDNPENDEIINRIEKYYDSFYKYWTESVTQK